MEDAPEVRWCAGEKIYSVVIKVAWLCHIVVFLVRFIFVAILYVNGVLTSITFDVFSFFDSSLLEIIFLCNDVNLSGASTPVLLIRYGGRLSRFLFLSKYLRSCGRDYYT